MPDIWLESQRLETGSTFFRWDKGKRGWIASRIMFIDGNHENFDAWEITP